MAARFPIALSASKAVTVALIVTVLFFLYFAHVIAGTWDAWVITALKPLFEPMNHALGKGYVRPLLVWVLFVVSVLGVALFMLPIRLIFGATMKSVLIALVAITPVVLVTLSDGVPTRWDHWLHLSQPVVGVALAFAYRKRRPAPGLPVSA